MTLPKRMPETKKEVWSLLVHTRLTKSEEDLLIKLFNVLP